MAWHLDKSYATWGSLDLSDTSISELITKDELLPGDIMFTPGNGGHTLIFEAWTSPAHTNYMAYEFGGGASGVEPPQHESSIPYPYWSSDSRVYQPRRYKNIVKDGPATATTHPTAVAGAGGVVDVFWKGTDTAIGHKWFSSGTWYGPESLGSGPLGSDPIAVTSSTSVVDVFWKGTDANLYRKHFNGSTWSGYENLGFGPLGSDPVAVGQPSGIIDVFWKRTDNALGHAWFSSGTWYGPESLGGSIG
jgi:hypothetical protein